MNPADDVIEHSIGFASTLEMEEENALDSTEFIALQLQGQQQGDLGYDDVDDGNDANENCPNCPKRDLVARASDLKVRSNMFISITNCNSNQKRFTK